MHGLHTEIGRKEKKEAEFSKKKPQTNKKTHREEKTNKFKETNAALCASACVQELEKPSNRACLK